MSGVRRGAQGGSTGSVETSPARAKRVKAARRRQEDRWAAKAGPVEVRRIDGAEYTTDHSTEDAAAKADPQ